MTIEGNGFIIKPVDERQLDAILSVYNQCEDFLSLGPIPNASEQMVIDDLSLSREEGGIFCGIFVEGQMIGVVDFVPRSFAGNPEEAYLGLLMIARDYRRRDLGRQVVAAVEAAIMNNPSVKVVKSGVQVNNPSAIAFWQRNGYTIVGGPTLMPDTTTVYELKKDIEQL